MYVMNKFDLKYVVLYTIIIRVLKLYVQDGMELSYDDFVMV